jgi:lipopolysaccharide export system permease protein
MSHNTNEDTYSKTKFKRTEVVFDLSSFGLIRTDKKWFASNRIMRNLSELRIDMDSVKQEVTAQELSLFNVQSVFFNYHFKKDPISMPDKLKKFSHHRDSLSNARTFDTTVHVPPALSANSSSVYQAPQLKLPAVIKEKDRRFSDSLFNRPETAVDISSALNRARVAKNQLQNYNTNIDSYNHEYRVFQIQWNKILANSIACIAMFLIGAPLGAIIKKGGLGMPVLASILFFILFYILSITGDKWALAETLPVPVGTWLSNVVLFTIGLFFLRQARADARLFDPDFYNVALDKIKQRWKALSPQKAKSI